MDESGVRIMAEVERGEVDEVEDQGGLGQDEVRADEEHHPGEMEQVVDNEVASHGACCMDCLGRGGEEVTDITKLQDENDEPEDANISHELPPMCVGGDHDATHQ